MGRGIPIQSTSGLQVRSVPRLMFIPSTGMEGFLSAQLLSNELIPIHPASSWRFRIPHHAVTAALALSFRLYNSIRASRTAATPVSGDTGMRQITPLYGARMAQDGFSGSRLLDGLRLRIHCDRWHLP